ncbi:MAG: tRNA uridine-5-carboxymethylaminomethyl(34) synthesis GTPase MnmE [Pseudomonadales bacterium]
MNYAKDTIVARATAPGQGGIGIVRVSGPLVADITRAMTGDDLPSPRYAAWRRFLDETGEAIDEGLTLYFKNPESFTGEDVAEFQCHGGPVVLDLLVQRAISLGARHASPGEFSQRAFLNDKIDLAQAEAIADLIAASSEGAARSAARTLRGEFSARVSALVAEVTQLRMFVEAAIDFPEEEVDFLEDKRIAETMTKIEAQLSTLIAEAGQGAILNEGAQVALAGKPNAGKSSLMNRLTGEDTAIVTDIPGTTRDLVTTALHLDQIPLHLVDTAGLRKSPGSVEAEGIRRATRAISEADLVIMVIDASLPEATRRQHLADLQKEVGANGFTMVLNKMDLVDDPASLIASGTADDFAAALPISCKTGEGIEQLKRTLKESLGHNPSVAGDFSARKRHLTALTAASEALARGSVVMTTDKAGELLAEELRQVQDRLGEITGVVTADDLLGEIFGSFCIGK